MNKISHELFASMYRAKVEYCRYKTTTDPKVMFSSDLKALHEHPYYQDVIEHGEGVIAAIIEDLKKNDYWWFHALRELTKLQPVKPEHAGNFQKQKEDWFEALRGLGYDC